MTPQPRTVQGKGVRDLGGAFVARPLAKIKVLDLSRILSGPFCTMLLADLGAEVVKVEQPKQGDLARRMEPYVGSDSAYFMSVNRGKKSITLNLKSKEGQRITRALSKQFDVLVENFVPGTMARLGLDYPRLRSLNRSLVYASISGFGQDGPYSKLPALDIVVQAMGGIMSLTGEAGRPPARPGASLGDSLAGLFGTIAILAALSERERSRRGRYIDISMFDCQITILENAFARYFATGNVPGPLGSRHPTAVPFQAFATLDGYVVVSILTNDPEPWKRFCMAIGHLELSNDSRFSDSRARLQNYDLLKPIMENAIAKKSSREWLKTFSRLKIPCGPMNKIDSVSQDSQVRYRNMIAEIPHRRLGKWRVANTPFKFSGALCGPQGPVPDLGEHTDKVLKEYLNLSAKEIKKLRSKGVI